MKRLAKVLAVLTASVVVLIPSTTANATVYKWANTRMASDSYSLKVGWCSGGTGTITQGTRTSKDVCKFYLPYNKWIWVIVDETGTQLFQTAYCGSEAGKWYTFNSRTDTSRTAGVVVDSATCV